MIDTGPIQRDVIRNAKQRARMHSANAEDSSLVKAKGYDFLRGRVPKSILQVTEHRHDLLGEEVLYRKDCNMCGIAWLMACPRELGARETTVLTSFSLTRPWEGARTSENISPSQIFRIDYDK